MSHRKKTQIYFKNYRKYKSTVGQRTVFVSVTTAGIHVYLWTFKYPVIIYNSIQSTLSVNLFEAKHIFEVKWLQTHIFQSSGCNVMTDKLL